MGKINNIEGAGLQGRQVDIPSGLQFVAFVGIFRMNDDAVDTCKLALTNYACQPIKI